MINNIFSSIIGFAVGDALGVPVEFMSRDVLFKKPLTNMVGYGTHNVSEGTWSDDTSMIIATIDSINNNYCVDYNDIMRNYLKWFFKSEFTATNEVFDIGITTKKAIYNYLLGNIGANISGCGGFYDNGNGSLMRVLPICFYSFYNNLSRKSEISLISNYSAMTHSHAISKLACVIYNDYLKNLLSGYSKLESLKLLAVNDYVEFFDADIISYFKTILSGSLLNLKSQDIKSSTYVVDTLESVLWSIIHCDTYEQSVLTAINLGNDTDTIGALTGGIAGLIYGYDSIPKNWLHKLKKIEYIDYISKIFEENLKERFSNKTK